MISPLLALLAWRFFLMAFLAIGGANAVVPEMHRQVVDVYGWMSASDFAALFAIASAAPGPNVLIVTLVGWQVAGLSGALVTTGAMIGSTGLLTFGAFRLWDRRKGASWQKPVQAGLSAVTVGLVGSSAYLLTEATATNAVTLAVALGTALVAWRTRINPLWCFALGAGLGAAGLL